MNGLAVVNPLFLTLLPLAALPILFHLFFRLRKQPRPFPSLLLFRRIDPQLSARRRLREWLVMLLRTLMLLFLLLALARPVWRGKGGDGPVAAVVIMDNSGSMSGKAQAGSIKLKEAITAAHGLVSQLRAQDTAGLVLLVEDALVPLPDGLVLDKGAVKRSLDSIQETEATGSPAKALEQAMALLNTSAASRFAIHVFSDLQEDKWNPAPAGLQVPRQGTSIRIHRIASPPAPQLNIALSGVRLPERNFIAERPFILQVGLTNPMAVEAMARLNWMDDAGNTGLQTVPLPPHQEKTLALNLAPSPPGLRWINLRIEGDEFPADNRASAGYLCTEKREVVFGGGRDEFGLLPMALAPFGDGKGSGLVPRFNSPADLGSRLREDNPVMLVLTWDALDQIGADSNERSRLIPQFVRAGGSLLLVPAVSESEALSPGAEWVGVRLEKLEIHQAGLPLQVLSSSAAVFSDLREAKGAVAWPNVKVFRFHPLRLMSNETPLLGLADGRVLLAERTLGRGIIYTSGLAFDPGWSTLPLKAGFLALAQNLALSGGATATNLVSLVAGNPFLSAPGTSPRLHVQSVTGSPLDWKGRREHLPVFPRSGVYAVRAEQEITYVSVRSSDKEGHQRFILGDRVPALGKLACSVQTYAGAESLHAGERTLEKSLDLFLPLFLLALLALLTEGWLANPPPIKTVTRPAVAPQESFVSRTSLGRVLSHWRLKLSWGGKGGAD